MSGQGKGLALWRILGKLVLLFLFVFMVVSGGVIFPINSGLAEQLNGPDMVQVKAGRGKAQLCTRCHGRLGMVHAIGKNKFEGTVEAFVIKELIDFKSGARAHAVMNSIAKSLSDEDITDVAAWYNHVSKQR